MLSYLPANNGMYSMIANRTLHLLSSANSTIAGNNDCDNCWIPITSLTQSRLEMMLSLTSGHSSLSWLKNKGKRCSMVLFFPRIGDKPIITEAKADLTCWLASTTRSCTHGRMLVMMTVSCTFLSRFWQKSRTLCDAAARTSASQSFNKLWKKNDKYVYTCSGKGQGQNILHHQSILFSFHFSTWNAGTRSVFVISGPTAFWRSVNLSATMYRTLQDLSSEHCLQI